MFLSHLLGESFKQSAGRWESWMQRNVDAGQSSLGVNKLNGEWRLARRDYLALPMDYYTMQSHGPSYIDNNLEFALSDLQL